MVILGFQKTTLLDYPGLVASTIFTGGCNFRCPYCHNSELVLCPDRLSAFSEDEIFAHLKKRKNILGGVCITGGEPTLQPDLIDFVQKVKDLGLLVKLDTNGSNPHVLSFLLNNGLLDYVAMDIKTSLDDYPRSCGVLQPDVTAISKSAALLLDGIIDYEFRTTVCHELHTNANFIAIGKWLRGANAYYLQPYQDSPGVLSSGLSAPTAEDLVIYQDILKKTISHVELRGISL